MLRMSACTANDAYKGLCHPRMRQDHISKPLPGEDLYIDRTRILRSRLIISSPKSDSDIQ